MTLIDPSRRAVLLGGAASLAATASGLAAPAVPGAAALRAIAPDALSALLVRAEALPQLHALIIARDGRTLGAQAFRGPALDRQTNVKSLSKTVMAILAGSRSTRAWSTAWTSRSPRS